MFSLSHCPDVPWQHGDFFVFRWNLKEVINTTNRWTEYILGEVVWGTTEQIRQKIWIDVKPLLPRWLHKFHRLSQGWESVTHMQRQRHHMTARGVSSLIYCLVSVMRINGSTLGPAGTQYPRDTGPKCWTDSHPFYRATRMHSADYALARSINQSINLYLLKFAIKWQ